MTWMTSQLNVALICKLRGSLIYLADIRSTDAGNKCLYCTCDIECVRQGPNIDYLCGVKILYSYTSRPVVCQGLVVQLHGHAQLRGWDNTAPIFLIHLPAWQKRLYEWRHVCMAIRRALKCCFIDINDHLKPRGLFPFRSNNKCLIDCSPGCYEDLP